MLLQGILYIICIDQSIKKLIKSVKRQATWRCDGCVPTQEIVHTEPLPKLLCVNYAIPSCLYDIESKSKLFASDIQEMITKLAEEKIQLEKLFICKKYTLGLLPLYVFYFLRNS